MDMNTFSMLLTILHYLGGGGGGLAASAVSNSWDPTDCSLPGSSVHGISQARILEWVAISFAGGSSQPKDGTWVSCIAGSLYQMSYPGKSLLSYSELITFS